MRLSGRHERIDHSAAFRRHVQETQTRFELVVTAISAIHHFRYRAYATPAAIEQDLEAQQVTLTGLQLEPGVNTKAAAGDIYGPHFERGAAFGAQHCASPEQLSGRTSLFFGHNSKL
jgi:hypothetical protein